MATKKKQTFTNKAADNLAVIYARFSPGPRQTEQSIEGQVRDCKAYAEQMGLKIVGIYADTISPALILRIEMNLTASLQMPKRGSFTILLYGK